MKKWLMEPLLHFLVIGALLFVAFSVVNKEEIAIDARKILVSAGDIERLNANWSKKWNRPPTDVELQGLIDSYIREEVYYREAIALGLDRNDTVLRRRLMQKMEFLSNDLADLNPPDETDLKQYFMANRNKYELPDRISFTHIYFSYDKRGEKVIEDTEQVLAAVLKDDTILRAPERGDPFILQYDFSLEAPAEVTRLFGEDFTNRLFALEPGSWQGPILSGYGLHLVRVVDRIAASTPELVEVVDKVRTDWMFEQREKLNREIYQRFRERYEIIIEVPPDSSSTAMTQTGRGESS